MNAVLRALAKAYRSSAAGRCGGARDFTVDYEAFLRSASLADGDAREQAEEDLAAAERMSGGRLRIDRQPRSGLPLRVRLIADGGEAWLFASLGEEAPAEARERLAAFFLAAAERPVAERFQSRWTEWLQRLATEAQSGASVQPFTRDDEAGNRELVEVVAGVLGWSGEALIRYASARLTGDSKRLEVMRPRLEAALRVIGNDEELGLESFGILRVPRTVTLHGPLLVELPEGRLDLSLLRQPFSLGGMDIERAVLRPTTTRCLTVENESVFLELARRRPDALLVLTSFAGEATRRFFAKLPPEIECWHFGDADPAGFEILRDLRERCGRPFRPVGMEFRPGGPRLTRQELAQIERLLASAALQDVRGPLEAMRASGEKGSYEQEGLDLDVLLSSWPKGS